MGKSINSGQDVFSGMLLPGPHSPHRYGELCSRRLEGKQTRSNLVDALSVHACVCNIMLYFYLYKYLKVRT